MEDPKIDNANTLFFHNFIVRYAVGFARARADVIEDECGIEESKKDSTTRLRTLSRSLSGARGKQRVRA
jgi:hypothetical protein